MSAYGTKKRGADEAVQLTFPLNFQKAFSAGVGFFPSDLGVSTDLMVGTDFQASYHEEKRQDANKVVMDGLQARRTQEQKLLTGHQNYHLPKPVLGQRKFANPAFGVVGFPSARRDGSVDAPFAVVESSGMAGSGMVGGVRTAEGNSFYHLQLQRRIEQLDKMNALAQGFPVPMGQRVNSFDAEKFGTKEKVNFFLYMRVLSDSIIEGDLSRFSFENLKEMMDMLFKFAPTTATEDDFAEMRDGWEEMLESMRQSDADANADANANTDYFETLKVFLEKGFQYIRQMSANVFRERRDKEALSRSLIKSLGFTSFLRRGERTEQVLANEARRNPRVGQAWENLDGRHGGDGDDDDGDGDGRFDRPAQGREDSEAGFAPRAPFAGRNADPNRERWGAKKGAFTGTPAAFFGEEGGEDEQREVAPLDLAGFDPSAQAPPQSGDALRNAVATDLEENLLALGWKTGTDIEEFYSSLGDGSGGEETQRRLVEDTADSLERKGYTPAQIAEGMRLLGYDFFSEYIGANAGDLRPPPIEPAFRRPVALAPTSVPFVPNVGRTALDPSAKEFRMDLGRLGLPTSRAELLAMDTEQMRAVGAKIPEEFGGPYKPRSNSKRASVRTRLIDLLRKIDPKF